MEEKLTSETEQRLLDEALASGRLQSQIDKIKQGLTADMAKLQREIPSIRDAEALAGAVLVSFSKSEAIFRLHANVVRTLLGVVLQGLSKKSYNEVTTKLRSLKLSDLGY